MAFLAEKRTGFLTYPDTKIVTLPTDRDMWPGCLVVKALFWAIDNALSLDAAASSERWKKMRVTPSRPYSGTTVRLRVL